MVFNFGDNNNFTDTAPYSMHGGLFASCFEMLRTTALVVFSFCCFWHLWHRWFMVSSANALPLSDRMHIKTHVISMELFYLRHLRSCAAGTHGSQTTSSMSAVSVTSSDARLDHNSATNTPVCFSGLFRFFTHLLCVADTWLTCVPGWCRPCRIACFCGGCRLIKHGGSAMDCVTLLIVWASMWLEIHFSDKRVCALVSMLSSGLSMYGSWWLSASLVLGAGVCSSYGGLEVKAEASRNRPVSLPPHCHECSVMDSSPASWGHICRRSECHKPSQVMEAVRAS